MTTENQTHIPEGWKSNKLGAICKVQKGVQFNKIELAEYGLYPCINGGIEPSGYSDLWNTNEDTITISEGGNSCGYVNFQRTKFWCGGHCYTLLNVQDGLDYEFLFWALKGKQDLIMDLRVGSGLPNIQQKAIKEFSFISPTSPTEQQKIASILSKLDEAITQTEQLIGKYKKIKEGLMHDLLTRGIDKQGNIRSEETHKFKDSPLGRIPVEWGIKCLNDCIDNSTTITYGIVQTFEHIENGVPVLRTLDLKEDELNPIENLLRTKKKISDSYKRTILKRNDIVCNVRASVGDYNLVTDIYENCNTTRGVARICPSKEFDNLYLLRFLQSYINKKQMEFYIKGTTFLDINIADLKKILVLIPDYTEQKRISRSLQAVQDMIKREQNQLSKYIFQKSGLMHDLLTGKIRVKIQY